MTPLSPQEFAHQLTLVVPERVLPRAIEVYFDAVTQLHERMTVATPVDTGYLRAGLTATAGDDEPVLLPPRNPKGDYTGAFGEAEASAISAIGEAAKTLQPITIGYTADYAEYVEDYAHMVKGAVAEWPAIVDSAVRNAEGA